MILEKTNDYAYIALSGNIRDIVISAIHEREENCWRGQPADKCGLSAGSWDSAAAAAR